MAKKKLFEKPYNEENAMSFADEMIEMANALLIAGVKEHTGENTGEYYSGIFGGICLAMRLFAEHHGEIPFTNEDDDPVVSFAINNGKSVINDVCDVYLKSNGCCDGSCDTRDEDTAKHDDGLSEIAKMLRDAGFEVVF